MNEYLFVITDYLKGKSVYPVLRRALNFLFTISIASFLFEKFYFKYHWLDISDYKAILTFFIKGYFFVPFSLFAIVHLSTEFFASSLFVVTTFWKSSGLLKKILNFQFKRKDTEEYMDRINSNPIIEMPVNVDESYLVKIYNHIKETVPAERWLALEKELENQKLYVRQNFNLSVKALIVITIYFTAIPYFGLLLYILALVCILLFLALLRIAYFCLDLLPAAIRKFHFEIDRYIASTKIEDNA